MAYSYEDLTIWVTASLTKALKGYPFGVPVIIKTQALEKNEPTPSWLEVIIDGPEFKRDGTKNERYGIVHVDIMVHTTYVPTDIYNHLRLRAKVIEFLEAVLPLIKVGAISYNGARVGSLVPLKTDSIKVTTVSTGEPDAALINATYCIDLC